MNARLNAGTLRILKGRCPNLLAEAGLYTYGESSKDRQGEKPLDDHNHALDALRYLIHKIDAHRRVRPADEPVAAEPPPKTRDRYASGWPDPDDESLWTPLGGGGDRRVKL